MQVDSCVLAWLPWITMVLLVGTEIMCSGPMSDNLKPGEIKVGIYMIFKNPIKLLVGYI